MGFVNNVLKEIAPAYALKRMQNQMAVRVLEQGKRKFEGAGRGRRFSDSGSIGPSQNLQISAALPLLRERSRNANRNNPYAKNATRRIAANVVGTGIQATPIYGGKSAKSVLKAAKETWLNWAEKTDCDFDGLQNLYGIQLLVIKTVIKSGECYVRRIWSKKSKKNKNKLPLELQVLDPDLLDHQKNSYGPMDNGEYTVNGVQFNKYGKRIAYWFYDSHPAGEFNMVSKPVPASDIKPVFIIDDPGQVHGIPENSTVILRMQDFDEYEDAQLMKQKIAACFAVFIQTPDAGSPLSQKDNDLIERVEPGMIQRGNAGETFTFASPPQVDGFKDYSRQSLQGVAAGYGMTYEALTGDLSGVNFSSGRMGWLEFQRNVEILQWNMMVPMFLDGVWDWFIEAAFLAGMIPTDQIGVTWTAPRREMIDPLKEVQAIIKQIRAGLISWQDAVRQLGYNPEEILAQLKADKDNFDAAGVMPESDPRYDPERMNKIVDDTPDQK